MSRWLITKGDHQFSAQDLNELKKLAKQGKVGPGDMVQPPGASDWLYAAELPELNGLLQNVPPPDDDLEFRPRKSNTPYIAVLSVLVLAGGALMYHYAQKIPDPKDLELLGENGMALTEMLVTGDPATLRGGPEESAASVGSLSKDSRIQLLGKRGEFYRVRDDGNTEGWVHINDVIPGYFFADQRTRDEYDPIYNPDKYVFIKNASWMQLPFQEERNITAFQFLIQNSSQFEMGNITILATVKDEDDRVLESKEITIEGTVSSYDSIEVGTLLPPEDEAGDEVERDADIGRRMTSKMFHELAQEDPDLNNLWIAGVEVQMESSGFQEAQIDLLEIQAIPQ